MNEKEFKRLVKKYHQNQLSRAEQKQLDAFENGLLKRNGEQVFKSTLHENQVRQDILKNITKEPTVKWNRILAIAASLVVLISLGLGVLTVQNAPTTTPVDSRITIYNPNNTPKTVHLEDGSTVILNKQSQISYSKGFEGNSRMIEMQGEAYFQVATDKEKPFTVVVDEVEVQVLGTEFNIQQADASIAVTVASGEVLVYDDDESHNLVSNEHIHFDRQSRTMNKQSMNHHLSSLWKQDLVSLKDISMAELSDALEQTHGYTLNFARKKFSELQLAISYSRQEPIEEIIRKVNYINNLNLTKTDETMIMVTKGD